MSTTSSRQRAVEKASSRAPRVFVGPDGMGKASAAYGTLTFDQSSMEERLPKQVFRSLVKTTHGGHKLDQSIAAAVAHAVKEWAIENGATHYCHWFQPLTRDRRPRSTTPSSTFGDDGEPDRALRRQRS